jgi:transaldolase
VQRPLWASTSTKNPAYRDVLYVEELVARDTVNTMPLETIEAFADHGEVRGQTVKDGMDRAHRLWGELAELGIDEADVGWRLEREGVQKFADSFRELLDGIHAKAGALVPA